MLKYCRVSTKTPKRPVNAEQGKRLREAMEARRWKVAELARRAGVDYDSAAKAVRGERDSRSSTLYALMAALGVSRHWIVSGDEPRDATKAEIEEYWAQARGTSSTDLVPVTASSLGIDIWLTETPDGHRTTPDEREWLRSFPWLDKQARYHDILFGTALQLYRQMAASTSKASDQASNR